jgi:hypothetical protein
MACIWLINEKETETKRRREKKEEEKRTIKGTAKQQSLIFVY